MAEYINRELLLKRFCEKCNEAMEDEPCEPAECFAMEIIKSLPKADVAEVRYGYWIDVGSLSCRCSECGCKNNRESKWCPNCGCAMEVNNG